jgi:hypothetical protein
VIVTALTVITLFVVLSARTGNEKVPGAVATAPIVGELVELAEGLPLPHVSAEFFPDAERGWVLQAFTENFLLLPDGEDQEDVAAGYLYLSIDGGERVRMSAPWQHLPSLSDGIHTIELILYNAEFQALSYGDAPLLVRYEVTKKGDELNVEEAPL